MCTFATSVTEWGMGIRGSMVSASCLQEVLVSSCKQYHVVCWLLLLRKTLIKLYICSTVIYIDLQNTTQL